jgi:hypothetical protein
MVPDRECNTPTLIVSAAWAMLADKVRAATPAAIPAFFSHDRDVNGDNLSESLFIFALHQSIFSGLLKRRINAEPVKADSMPNKKRK